MIIEENQLRPPSPKEMEERRVWLEKVVFVNDGPTPRAYAWPVNEISTLDLIEFHKQWAIPYEARLLPGYDQDLILDWTHLALCEGCASWYAVDTEHDTGPNSVHDYISRARAAAMRWASEGSRKRRGLM